MKTIRIIACTILFAVSENIKAQSTVHYTYDNAGNRICQEIISDNQDRMQRFGTMGNGQNGAKGGEISGLVGGHMVRASVQPGVLRVEILGLRPDDRCLLNVYTMNGQLLLSKVATGALTFLDINKQVYVLQVSVNDEKEAWKVIGQ